MNPALGLLETQGLVCLIHAVDALRAHCAEGAGREKNLEARLAAREAEAAKWKAEAASLRGAAQRMVSGDQASASPLRSESPSSSIRSPRLRRRGHGGGAFQWLWARDASRSRP